MCDTRIYKQREERGGGKTHTHTQKYTHTGTQTDRQTCIQTVSRGLAFLCLVPAFLTLAAAVAVAVSVAVAVVAVADGHPQPLTAARALTT